MDASSKAFKTNKHWSYWLTLLLASFQFSPLIAPNGIFQRLAIPGPLVQLLMFFGNFGGMILLIIGVLHGPATWPILRICPQGLMDGFRLMKAPAVQVLQCLSNGQPHATANDHQGRSTALLPGFQGIMQTCWVWPGAKTCKEGLGTLGVEGPSSIIRVWEATYSIVLIRSQDRVQDLGTT